MRIVGRFRGAKILLFCDFFNSERVKKQMEIRFIPFVNAMSNHSMNKTQTIKVLLILLCPSY